MEAQRRRRLFIGITIATIATLGVGIAMVHFAGRPGAVNVVELHGPFPSDWNQHVDQQTSLVKQVQVWIGKVGTNGLITVRFSFDGEIGANSPMAVRVMGWDAYGNEVVNESQNCSDGRGITEEQATVWISGLRGVRMTQLSQPEFYMPLDTMNCLARVKVSFEPLGRS